MITRSPGEGFPRSGEFHGTQWSVEMTAEGAIIHIDGQQIHVEADGHGGYVTHELVGRWRDPAEIADLILRWHPDYSPLARDRNFV